MAIYQRRDGWEVRVYAGVDPLTGKPHRISRQIRGSRRQAEREETRLKAEVMAGRHRGTAAKTFGELVEIYLASTTASRSDELAADAYVFSVDEAGRRPLRFGDLARRLGHGYTLYGFPALHGHPARRGGHHRDHPRAYGPRQPRRDRDLRAPGQRGRPGGGAPHGRPTR